MTVSRRNWLVSFSIILILLVCFTIVKTQITYNIQSRIVVDCSFKPRLVESKIGFLHSFSDTEPAQQLINELSPKVWRVGGKWLSPKYRSSSLNMIRGNKMRPIVLFSDYYYLNTSPKGRFPIRDHEDKFLSLVEEVYTLYGNNVIYDLWNEPNLPTPYWPEPEESFLYAFKLAHDKIRSLPNGDKALISGPSISFFDVAYLERFLKFCSQNSVRVDVLSWHDFRNGKRLQQLSDDIKWVKSSLIKRYPNVGVKSIQINEIIGEKDQYSPLVALMYFKVLELGGADAASKACWKNSKGISNCGNNSLDGLIDETGKPRSIWWAYKYYNESTMHRLQCSSSSENLMPFAYVNPSDAGEVRILVANYKNQLNSLTISLNSLKSLSTFRDKNSVLIKCIEIPDSHEAALEYPLLLSSKRINIKNISNPSAAFNGLKPDRVYVFTIK